MVNSNTLFLLLTIYTALVAICVENKMVLAVAAPATATSVNLNRGGTCGPGPDQPHCDDPSYEGRHRGAAADGDRRPTNTSSGDGTIGDDGGDCGADCGERAQQPPRQRQRQPPTRPGGSIRRPVPPGRFQSGDVVELYNTESRDVQIVFPSLVKGWDPDAGGGGYRVTKTTDGKEVAGIPDRHMHLYVPYRPGDEALCNIGEFRPARPIIVRCTVLSYAPAATRGAMVLQGTYEVRVHETRANEEYATSLPVWKMQRRYQATTLATG